MGILPDLTHGHGAGSRLPQPVLIFAGVSTFVAVVVSGISIWLQLRNYRKPLLQRMVIRIMLMVPLYAVASLISLFSLEAAFFIDAIRDIYEAFVIYCFFVLLLDYLGGERSLLMMLHGRPPIPAIFPVSLWRNEIDVSDPYTFLFLKRGILQYVQVKPLLALASLIMKATGTYNEGDFRARSGYLYLSIIYNTSICLALWCLAVFWMCVNNDLKPFRPVPKFLCVKGILFFSFWQSILISTLVALSVITRLGPYTDREHISLGLTDTLICFEMPFFAAAHMYAFSYRDFIQPPPSSPRKNGALIFVSRMRLAYAFRDAFGLKDVVEDTRTTLRGEGINYRAFEPTEGGMHIGAARERRIRAGLRYLAGGKRKYWLPEARGPGEVSGYSESDVAALLSAEEAEGLINDTPDMHHQYSAAARIPGDDAGAPDDDEYSLRFSDALAGPGGVDELLYEHAKKNVFGDYLYPVVDVSSEEARWAMWDEESRVARESICAVSGRKEDKQPTESTSTPGYGATQSVQRTVIKYEDADKGFGRQERVVDFEEGDSSSISDGMRLAWTKVGAKSKISSSPSLHASARDVSHLRNPTHPSFSVSSSKSQSRITSPPMGSGSEAHLQAPPAMRSASHNSHSSSRSKSSRTPLAKDDAVDLIIPASDSRRKPSSSPQLPALVRVWDESSASSVNHSQVRIGSASSRSPVSENDKDARVGREVDVPEVVEPDDTVFAQTSPPYAQGGGYYNTASGDEDNPWA